MSRPSGKTRCAVAQAVARLLAGETVTVHCATPGNATRFRTAIVDGLARAGQASALERCRFFINGWPL